MTCFLDVQGFQLARRYVVKEIAVVCSEGKIYNVWTLLPPCHFEDLSLDDRVAVKRTSNYKLGLAWTDGAVPYKHLESVFVQIAREFKRWIVADERVKDVVFPYKSRSVAVQTVESFCKLPASDLEAINAKIHIPSVGCLFDHPLCVVQNCTRLLNIYLQVVKEQNL